jgi:phage shock protein C
MTTETDTTESKRLYKSRRDRMIDGVCGGIGEYFDIDPTIVRGVFILLALFGGSGLFVYIAGMIIIPVNPQHLSMMYAGEMQPIRRDGSRMWGVVLLGIGLIILLHNIGWFAFYQVLHVSWGLVLPIMIILLGMALIYAHQNTRRSAPNPETTEDTMETQANETSYRRLYKSRRDRKLFGVCGGLGEYFDIDPTLVRILFILLTFLSFGTGIVMYLAMAIFVPEERRQRR